MPDWIVHVAVTWSLCRVLRFKYPQFNPGNTALAMAGSVLPDVVKMGILFDLLGHDWWDYIYALHEPVGSFLVAGLASLLFKEKKTAFLFFSLGILTHYALDILMIQVSDGLYLFYPVSWLGFHLDLFTNDDYLIWLLALAVALVVYVVGWWVEKKQGTSS